MSAELYRYQFAPTLPQADIDSSLVLALFATETLHGETQVRLDASYYFDREQRASVIDAGTPVGRDVNKLFSGFLRKEFGDDSFRVERVREPRPVVVH